MQKLGANLKKTRSKYPNPRPSKRSSKLGKTTKHKPGHLTMVIQWNRDFSRISAAMWRIHPSIFDAWPHLAFQILLLPINTAFSDLRWGDREL